MNSEQIYTVSTVIPAVVVLLPFLMQAAFSKSMLLREIATAIMLVLLFGSVLIIAAGTPQ